MEWIEVSKKRPPHGEKVWVWDNELRQQFVITYFGSEESWDDFKDKERFLLWAYLNKSHSERQNPEVADSAWIKWKDLEPPKDIKGIFIKFDDDRIWTDAHYWGSDEYRIKTVGDAKPVSWTFMERLPPTKMRHPRCECSVGEGREG